MKKSLLLLMTALFISSAAFTQILTEWEFGPTMFSPSITTNGAPTDFDIVSHIKVTNTTASAMTIKVATQILQPVANQIEQFCWGGLCFAPGTDTSGLSMTLGAGESTVEFSGHVQPNGISGVYIIRYSFFDVNNSANHAEVIVHYNSIFSVSSEAGEELSAHARLLSGTVDEPIHGKIKVHNNSLGTLSIVALKGAQLVPDGTENRFDFGGVQYPSTVDTSAVYTLTAAATDESFEAYYDANGVEGAATVVYAFLDPLNPAAYAVFRFDFDASLGIGEEILANTVFSAAYPNPAGDFVSFDYDIPNSVNKASVVIINLLGGVVHEAAIEGMIGTARINISNLSEGIYFATLKLNNYAVNTQKVLVR